MASENETQTESRPQATRSRVLIAAYGTIVGWAFYEQSTSWPHEGSWLLIVYAFLCPGIVFQAFSLAYARLRGRALTRLLTIPVGVVLAAPLAASASALAMRSFEQAYAPFVAQLAADLAGACATGAKHFAMASVAAYNRQAGRERPQAVLKHDGKRFVLSFSDGSIDIDGSTIYYDSGARAWGKFHNDSTDKSAAFGKLTEGLAECVLRTAWSETSDEKRVTRKEEEGA